MAATVWVLDDDESVREVLAAMLRELGYQVELFSNGQDALAAYSESPPEVVITDIRMPGMSGMDVTRSLLDMDPDAVVMILTGFPSIPDAVEAIKLGAKDFLSKPCRMDEIRLRIERALETRELNNRLKRTKTVAWALIATLPLWFVLGMALAYVLTN